MDPPDEARRPKRRRLAQGGWNVDIEFGSSKAGDFKISLSVSAK